MPTHTKANRRRNEAALRAKLTRNGSDFTIGSLVPVVNVGELARDAVDYGAAAGAQVVSTGLDAADKAQTAVLETADRAILAADLVVGGASDATTNFVAAGVLGVSELGADIVASDVAHDVVEAAATVGYSASNEVNVLLGGDEVDANALATAYADNLQNDADLASVAFHDAANRRLANVNEAAITIGTGMYLLGTAPIVGATATLDILGADATVEQLRSGLSEMDQVVYEGQARSDARRHPVTKGEVYAAAVAPILGAAVTPGLADDYALWSRLGVQSGSTTWSSSGMPEGEFVEPGYHSASEKMARVTGLSEDQSVLQKTSNFLSESLEEDSARALAVRDVALRRLLERKLRDEGVPENKIQRILDETFPPMHNTHSVDVVVRPTQTEISKSNDGGKALAMARVGAKHPNATLIWYQ